MEFIKSVVYADADSNHQECTGLLLTQYDPKELYTRPKPLYVPRAQLSAHLENAAGWTISEDGVVLADSTDNAAAIPEAMLLSALSGEDKGLTPGIVDILRFALIHNGFVLPEFEVESEKGLDVRIPVRTFRVSQSSFNIYAPYSKEGSFRTFSLLNPIDGSGKEFFIALDIAAVPSNIKHLVAATGTTFQTIEGQQLYVFSVHAALQDCNPFLGGAFVNFLAFYVAFNDIGLRMAKIYSKSISTPTEERPVVKPLEPKERAAKPANLQIVHTWADCNVASVMRRLGNGEPAAEIMEKVNGAAGVIEWTNIMRQRHKTLVSAGKEGAWASVYMDVRLSAETYELCYGLELLEQRYVLFNLGWVLDQTGLFYRGGGVYGISRKLR